MSITASDILSLLHVTSKEPTGKGLNMFYPETSSVLALTPESFCRDPTVSTRAVSSFKTCAQAISIFLIF